jgi:hypothetical protein
VLRIHEAALDALETIGLSQAPPSGVEIMTRAGAILGDDGRLRFPRALVEDMLAIASRDITLFGRDPKHDLILSGTRVHYGTAGAAVHMVDPVTNTYRESTVQDLYDAARLTQNLDNVHFFQRAMVCRDIADNFEMDINTIYACCAGTKKHVGTSVLGSRPCRRLCRAAASDRGRRSGVAGAALRVEFQLLRRAADEVRRGKLHHHGGADPRRHAGAAVVGGAGGGHGAGADRAGGRAGGGRMPGRGRLCQRDRARASGGLRHLALRERPAVWARCRAGRPNRRC